MEVAAQGIDDQSDERARPPTTNHCMALRCHGGLPDLISFSFDLVLDSPSKTVWVGVWLMALGVPQAGVRGQPTTVAA